MSDSGPTLGERLRAIRADRGLSLRAVERKTGVNSGYLSQLERNEVTNPGPSVLKKIAKGYGEPFPVLMRWAGYVEDDPDGLSPNAQRALSVLGDDFTDRELDALKAVLDAIRTNGRAGYTPPHPTDIAMSFEDRVAIGQQAHALLRELGSLRDERPVDLDEALNFAHLVRTGVVELSASEQSRLRRRFGDLVDKAFRKIQGVVHFGDRSVYVDPSMYELKQRFVLGHEIGHSVLPDHRDTFAYLDDHARLKPDFRDRLERQANHFSIELLAKGDLLRAEFDDSPPSRTLIDDLHRKYGISLQALVRRVAEESHRAVAVAIAHKAGGRRMPARLYCSAVFDEHLAWDAQPPHAVVRAALDGIASSPINLPVQTLDARAQPVSLEVCGIDTPHSTMAMFWLPLRRNRKLVPTLLR